MALTKQQTVFVVDDNKLACKAATRALSDLDVQVTSFGNAETCLKHLSMCHCHLLIAEIIMQETDGIAFLKQIKAVKPWLPVMVVTGWGSVPLAVESMKMGASDFIEKPLDRATFLASARRLLTKSGNTNERLGRPLTEAEMRVLPHILAGQSSKDIAKEFFRSTRTVELHRQHIMRKMGVKNVVELVQRVRSMSFDTACLPPGPCATSHS